MDEIDKLRNEIKESNDDKKVLVLVDDMPPELVEGFIVPGVKPDNPDKEGNNGSNS